MRILWWRDSGPVRGCRAWPALAPVIRQWYEGRGFEVKVETPYVIEG